MNKKTLPTLAAAVFALILANSALADRIELADGSIINGKLLSAEGGKFKFETGFAGTIEIAQAAIKTLVTDAPVNVGLESGSTILGRVGAGGMGVQIASASGPVSSTPSGIKAIWQQGADSPEVRARARKWAYEAAVGINGRSGGAEKFAAALAFKATLESSQDKLIFNLQAEKAEDNGVETANRQFAGVDYSSFFTPNNVWYARTSVEKDAIKALDLRSSTAFGIGRKLIKKPIQDLEARVGISYLYETYANGTKFDSPGLDLALVHSYQFKNGKLANALTYTPTFEDFGNFRVHHESTFEMPITASLWKLKLGLTNDYTSMPQPGIDRLDTLYFTSLILNWK
ncbi:MAG TPA: DUF481 domain-containing protein [Lacunisphaera sp.]|nr:DUF481 domain-containing protein [Lacunisphaera sp.]